MFCLLPESISLLLAQLLLLSRSLHSAPLKLELAGEQVDLLHPCPQLRTLRREEPRRLLLHLLVRHVCDLGGSVEMSERRRNVVLQQGLNHERRIVLMGLKHFIDEVVPKVREDFHDLFDALPIFCCAALLVVCALHGRFLGLQGLGDKLFDILEDPNDAVLVGRRRNEMVEQREERMAAVEIAEGNLTCRSLLQGLLHIADNPLHVIGARHVENVSKTFAVKRPAGEEGEQTIQQSCFSSL
mmetsp:Transcript_9860/g.32979  ORF Transcript_9860/g.32979 Transcript_9860/m.32979 type:complete len:242 (+) Transcript_9860:280-1005(+)